MVPPTPAAGGGRRPIGGGASYVLVTGLQASGKSTVARALAERFARGAHVEGDSLITMVVSGREQMSRQPSTEALRQLQLRYDLGLGAAVTLRAAGFTAIHSDIVLGADVARCVASARPGPVRVVVLTPDVGAIAARERSRPKDAYGAYAASGQSLEEVLQEHRRWIEDTPELGVRIDSTAQTVEQTVDEILERWDDALVE